MDTLKYIMEVSKTEERESVILILGDHGLHRSWLFFFFLKINSTTINN